MCVTGSASSSPNASSGSPDASRFPDASSGISVSFLSSDYASCSSNCDDDSYVSSEDSAFTNDSFHPTDIYPTTDETASFRGKGAGEFFDEVLSDTSSSSASEECTKESSDANFFNINFLLPGNDFWTYFPGASKKFSNLNQYITTISIPENIIIIKKQAFSDCTALTNIHTQCVCPYYKAAPYNISHTKIF